MAADLSIVVKLVDKASGPLRKLKGTAGALGGALRKGALVGVAGLAALGVAAFKFGNDFVKAKNIIVAGTGASGEALEGLYDDAKKVFAAIPTDIDKAASAVADWNTLMGLSGEIGQEASKRSLEAARILGEDSKALIEAGARAFNVYEVAGKDVPAMLDKVFVASQATGLPMTKLLGLVQTYGPVLKNMGFGLQDTIAFMGSMEKAGIDISRVMPGLNAYTRKLAEEGITDLKGALFGTVEQIKAATSDADALNIATEAFGAEGAQRMSVAVRTGALDVKDLVAQMGGAEGSILDTAKASETWQEKLKILRNKVLVKLEPLLVKFVDLVGELADWLGEKIPVAIDGFVAGFKEADVTSKGLFGTFERIGKGVREFIDGARPIVKEFLRLFIVGLGTLKEALEPVVRFILNNKPVLIAAIAAIGIAILLAFGPGAIVIAAIIGLITLIGLLRENWDEIKATVTGAVDSIIAKIEGIPVIGEIFKATVQIITDKIEALKGFIQGLIDFVQELVDFVKAIFRGDWAAAWDSLKEMAKIALNLFLDWLDLTFYGTIKSIITAINPWKWIQPYITGENGIVPKVTGAFNDVKDAIVGAFTDAKTGIGNILNSILRTMTEFVNAGIRIANKVIGVYESMVNAIIGAINAIPSVSLPFGLGTIGIPDINKVTIPRIPTLEGGGRVLETGMAVVHKGEEFSRSGGDTFIFHHHGTLMGNEAEAERFAAMIDTRLRRKWRRQHA